MEFGCKTMYFVGFCVLISLIRTSVALECYACNVSSSTADEDGCYGIGSIKKCAPNSVCLTATYEIQTGSVRTYTNMQSCFPDMASQECTYFIKSQKDLQRTATVTSRSCYSCQTDNCNKSKSRSNSASSAKIRYGTVLVAIFTFCVGRLIISKVS